MSVKVIIKGEQREVAGKTVKINEECRLPHDLARTLESKGLCVIVAIGEPVAMETRVQPDVEIKTKVAKKAVAKSAKITKARADAKKKAAKK
jgi:hypothetical protein